jgi:hypothetical protein
MGGAGSGNYYHWWRSGKKTVVEDCLSLDANRWTREGILRAGVLASGSWQWTYSNGQGFIVSYQADATDPDAARVGLSYSWVWPGSKDVQSESYPVRLTATFPRFGGRRWWFVCPLVVNGRACNRRVGKLYLPPRGRYFGCRHCHRLTYRSAQEHDPRVSRLRRNPELLLALMDNFAGASVTQLGLILKALPL